ncbi:hypothetical protein CP533_6478 [Ophiocordyceps camponoti-saundersi (nom. inval.)]|nr:hypothetical protein CP533_6478 [Ophiocordyceps camponoti-saundersi (nom. inval.)]
MQSSQPGLDSELESFRQQWLSDLRTRRGGAEASSSVAVVTSPPLISCADDVGDVGGDDVDEDSDDCQRTSKADDSGSSLNFASNDLVSALDFYEAAMEKEAEGNMGDSLKLYRQAYRIDPRVDHRYREKHPPASPPATAPVPAPLPQFDSAADLIASFAGLSIVPVAEASSSCPLAALPDELLVLVLSDVAAFDPGVLTAGAALACKRLAYLSATEQRIWRRVSLSTVYGFPAMHYRFCLDDNWEVLPDLDVHHHHPGSPVSSAALIPSTYASWSDMFRRRPRIRFNGCYISTVNYVRPGHHSASAAPAAWAGSSPVHIVTYYRYLRFFRDGSLISLLTTVHPADIVHQLTLDQLRLHRHADHSHSTHSPMRLALRGRWHLVPDDDETSLLVETEGVGPKYLYSMHLLLRRAGRAACNNKLVWKSFHSYNKLTDDWAEFGLKNDKPFIFSRVRSYGMGQ